MRESVVFYFSGIILNGFLYLGGIIAEHELLPIVAAIAMLIQYYFIYKTIN